LVIFSQAKPREIKGWYIQTMELRHCCRLSSLELTRSHVLRMNRKGYTINCK
jgi:hypothetical protein